MEKLFNLTLHNQSALSQLNLSQWGIDEVEIQPRLKPVDDVTDYNQLKSAVRNAVKDDIPSGACVLVGGLGQFQALITQLQYKVFFANFDPIKKEMLGLIPHQPFSRAEIYEIENG